MTVRSDISRKTRSPWCQSLQHRQSKAAHCPKTSSARSGGKRAASGRLLGLEVKEGPVSTEVMIETAAGEKIVSSITTTSAKNLGLKMGGKAYAIIKATNVMIGIED